MQEAPRDPVAMALALQASNEELEARAGGIPWPPAPVSAHGQAAGTGPVVFEHPRRFIWKTALLAATTIALIPILLAKDSWAATVYLVVLIVVHVAGIFIVAIGVRRRDIAPDRRGFVYRIIAIVCLVALLYLVSQGLRSATADYVFWGSLFLIWLLHTLGLVLLHVKGRREAACPFV
jgi:hypothetical protein